MSVNLNNAERELFEIFKRYKVITDNSISIKDIVSAQNEHEYMSPSNYPNLRDILKSLESKGLIEMKDNDLIYLTQLGEDCLWRG